MDKYRQSLISNIQDQLSRWFDGDERPDNKELIRFIHALKGTAGTIGMMELSATAEELLDRLDEESDKVWTPELLRSFVFPVIKFSFEHDPQHDDTEAASLPPSAGSGAESLILIVDDDASMLMYLKEQLERHGWMVIATTDSGHAIRYFHDMKPDCMIIDIVMPEKNGFEVMESLKDKLQQQMVPTLVLTGSLDRQIRLRSYRMGVDDFMNKPVDMEQMIVRIERLLGRKRMLDSMLLVDELTGAYNRKYLSVAFGRQVTELLRNSRTFSLAVMDLDHFKKVNDTYGHLIGDQVLSGFSAFIREHGRPTDILVRFGGEEFVLLLPETGANEAKLVLERLLVDFGDLTFNSAQGQFHVTFSAGVTEVTDAKRPMNDWILLADTALYQAKQTGRNRIALADTAAAPTKERKLRIAVVDDEAVIRTMLAESIPDMLGPGMEAEIGEFRDGLAFMDSKWHEEQGQCLVVLDVMMPRMDGLEVLRKLRSLPYGEQYMVIMLTGRGGEQDIVRALQLGADDYMTKPFIMSELEARIKRLIQRMKAGHGK